MRTDDVFNDIDSRTADRLAKEYPVLRDEQKERLYAMSKRKFDIKIDNSSIDVSGVEKYRRPKWFKGVSVAAAALLLVAGIGGSMYRRGLLNDVHRFSLLSSAASCLAFRMWKSPTRAA